jgi:hypothetical protein
LRNKRHKRTNVSRTPLSNLREQLIFLKRRRQCLEIILT